MKNEDLDILKTYLTEEEIKDIVIAQYQSIIRKEIENIEPNRRMDNYERILSNAVHYYLEKECDALIGANHKEIIKTNVNKTLAKSDLSYSVFRTKSAWDKEDSIGTTIMKEAVLNNRSLIEDKVIDIINSMEISQIKESLTECLIELIDQKLKA